MIKKLFHISTFLLISLFLFPKITYGVDYSSIESSSNCVEGTVSSSAGQISMKVFVPDVLTSNSQNSYDCFWTGGTVYLGHNTSNWHDSVSDTFSNGDVLKCEWIDGVLCAYRNNTQITCGSDNTYSNGNYIGAYHPGSTFSTLGACSEPEPTPTPTDTPTPTGTITPTPTPTTTYYHQICVHGQTKIGGFRTVSGSTNDDLLPITAQDASYLDYYESNFDISSLDITEIRSKTFLGIRFYHDVEYNINETGIYRIATSYTGTPNIELANDDNLPDRQYTCNGYTELSEFSTPKDGIELFDQNGSNEHSAGFISHSLPNYPYYNQSPQYNISGTISDFAVCYVYSDNISTNSISIESDCAVEPPDTTICPLFSTDTGGWFVCQINKIKTWFQNLFVPKSDFIPRLSTWYTDNQLIENQFTATLYEIVFFPINTLVEYADDTCQPLVFPLPMFNTQINLPCPRQVLQDYFGNYFALWDILSGGFITYGILLKILQLIYSLRDPKKSDMEVLQI